MTLTATIVGFDFETRPTSAQNPWPDPVCMSLSGGADSLDLLKAIEAAAGAEIWHKPSSELVSDEWAIVVRGHLCKILLRPEFAHILFVAHNAAFEIGVIRTVLGSSEGRKFLARAMMLGQFRCTMVREMLFCVANNYIGKGTYDPRLRRKDMKGPHGLAQVASARFPGTDLNTEKKAPDSWRLRYHTLVGIAIASWPIRALQYSALDAVWARRIYYHQALVDVGTAVGSIVKNPETGEYWDELDKQRRHVCFSILQDNGPGVDPHRLNMYRHELMVKADKAMAFAREGGWIRDTGCKSCEGTGKVGDPPMLQDCPSCDGGRAENIRPKTTKTKTLQARQKLWVEYAYSGNPPATDKGNTKIDQDTMAYSGHRILEGYAKGISAKSALDRQIPLLEEALRQGKVTPWFILLVRTGRSSCRGPNMQNPDSKGLFRSCFVAKPKKVMVSIDYSTLEMFAWAQSCLDLYGVSTMAEWLNSIDANGDPMDVHSVFGRHVLKVFYNKDISLKEFMDLKKAKDPEVLRCRTFAKVPIFGCPGMMQKPASLVEYALGMGIELSLEDAESLISLWNVLLEESRKWLKDMKARAPWGKTFTLIQPISGRIRGGCYSSSGANSYFQGRSADFTSEVLARLILATEVDETSPLYGVKIWNFVHDEFMFEGDVETSHLWIAEAQRIMLLGKERFFPGVHKHMRTEATASVRWDKKADIEYLPCGRVLPWEFSKNQKGGPKHQDLPASWILDMPQYLQDYVREELCRPGS